MTDQLNMFAVLEHQERTAGFPSVNDEAAQIDFWRSLIVRYNSAMLAGDTDAAVSIHKEAHLLIEHIHGGRCGCASVADRLKAATAAPEGSTPLWGQSGRFVLEFASVPVLIEVDGLCGLGSWGSLLPHFEIRAVETHRMFLSSSGYRSFFSQFAVAIEGTELVDAIRGRLDFYYRGELKGKLVKLGDKPAAPEPVDDDDTDDGAEDAVCADCGVELAQLDEYFECNEDGGARCPECNVAHADNCVDCAAVRESIVAQNLAAAMAGGAGDPRNARP
jgi:hypothetical protein